MSAVGSHTRAPLVFASPRAQEQAARLLPGRVLENIVTAQIASGEALFGRGRRDGEAVVQLGSGLVAIAKRTRSPMTGRKAWRVVAVRPEGEFRTDDEGS